MNFVILAHARRALAARDVMAEVTQRIARPMRRAGMLAHMALLACLDVVEQGLAARHLPDSQPQGTALLWHSRQGPQAETEALLAAQQEGDGLLLPFDFLAGQPALLCQHLGPWVPGLQQTLFLPHALHPREQPWLQSLQLASMWLAEGRFQRVICASLERDHSACRHAAVCLMAARHLSASDSSQLVHGRWVRKNTGQPSPAPEPVVSITDADAALWRMLDNSLQPETLLESHAALLHVRRGAP